MRGWYMENREMCLLDRSSETARRILAMMRKGGACRERRLHTITEGVQ